MLDISQWLNIPLKAHVNFFMDKEDEMILPIRFNLDTPWYYLKKIEFIYEINRKANTFYGKISHNLLLTYIVETKHIQSSDDQIGESFTYKETLLLPWTKFIKLECNSKLGIAKQFFSLKNYSRFHFKIIEVMSQKGFLSQLFSFSRDKRSR